MKKNKKEKDKTVYVISLAFIFFAGIGVYAIFGLDSFSEPGSLGKSESLNYTNAISNNISNPQLVADLENLDLILGEIPNDLQYFDESLYDEPLIQP